MNDLYVQHGRVTVITTAQRLLGNLTGCSYCGAKVGLLSSMLCESHALVLFEYTNSELAQAVRSSIRTVWVVR